MLENTIIFLRSSSFVMNGAARHTMQNFHSLDDEFTSVPPLRDGLLIIC